VKVRVSIAWEVIVDGKVDTFNINTTTEHIGGHADSLVELLEFFVALDTISLSAMEQSLADFGTLPFLLTHARVDCDRWEVALAQELVKLSGSDGALHEDDDLVELKFVK
jgi:hypothetical protein